MGVNVEPEQGEEADLGQPMQAPGGGRAKKDQARQEQSQEEEADDGIGGDRSPGDVRLRGEPGESQRQGDHG